jgi:nitrite reductase/ring-hydroxylating ferredoxin subunit
MLHRKYIPFFILLFIISCNRDNNVNYYTRVDFSININEARYSNLQTNNSAVVVEDNVFGENATAHGVIIFRDGAGEFFAYDRVCPYQINKRCAVDFTDDMIIVKCPCCESEFLLNSYGDPVTGPAEEPLIQYNAYLNGSYLNVYGRY